MITVIDRTFSLIPPEGDPRRIRALMERMLSVGANILELSEEMYGYLRRDLPVGKYILRLTHAKNAEEYPEIHRFVASGTLSANATFCEEFVLHSAEQLLSGGFTPVLRPVRLSGLDQIGEDEEKLFKGIHEIFRGYIEFAPCGDASEATSLSAEWILDGGNCVVSAIGGYGGYTSFEEIICYLHAVRRRRPAVRADELSALRALLGRLTDTTDLPGDFGPVLRIGQHSSCHTVKFKLDQIGRSISAERLKTVTSVIRAEGKRLGRLLADHEVIAVL